MPRAQKPLVIPKKTKITPDLAFAIVLRKRRNELGLRQEDLEDETGLDRSYISKLELGKNQICLGNFIHIAGKLQMSATELMDAVLKEIGK